MRWSLASLLPCHGLQTKDVIFPPHPVSVRFRKSCVRNGSPAPERAASRYDLFMRMILFLTAGLLLAQGPSPPGMRCPQRTLVMWERGPNWDKARDVAPKHLAYMLQLMKSGKVLSAGPTQGTQPAAVGVFAAGDWAGVESVLKDEPFTREGVLKVASHTVWSACEAAPPG